MQSNTTDNHITLYGAAHFDRTGWLNAPADEGCSNPGRFEEYAGGTALNIAGVLTSLQLSPQLITRMGDDALAAQLRTTAEQRGIAISAQHSRNNNTGTYTSLIEPDGSLFIALADMAVYDEFTAAPYIDEIQHLDGGDIICIDANLPEAEIRRLVSNTPARCIGLSVSKAKSVRLSPVLGALDTLFTNRTEVCALTQTSQLHDAITALQSSGLTNAVISDGANAIWIMEGSAISKVEVKPLDTVVDVTGAGDALAGGTLFGLARGMTLTKAVEIGVLAAQKVIQTKGPWCPDLAGALNIPPPSRDL